MPSQATASGPLTEHSTPGAGCPHRQRIVVGRQLHMNHAETMVIQTHDLSKEYAGVRALDGLNLNVPKHSIFGFLGANGAGKSTTIKLLLGLIQPTGGSATVFGQDIVQDNVTIRTRVGYLAQDPRFYD